LIINLISFIVHLASYWEDRNGSNADTARWYHMDPKLDANNYRCHDKWGWIHHNRSEVDWWSEPKGKFFIPLVLAFQVSINFFPFYLYLHLEMILKADIHPFLLASILFCSQRDTKSDKEWCCKREHATLGATRYGLGRPQVLISEANWRRHFAFVSPFLPQPCFFSCLLLSLLTIAFFKFRVYRSGDRQSSWARCIGA